MIIYGWTIKLAWRSGRNCRTVCLYMFQSSRVKGCCSTVCFPCFLIIGHHHHHHKTSFNDLHDTYDSYDTLRMSASWDLRSLKALLNGYAKSQNSQRAAQWLECMEANDIKPSISAHLSPAMSPMYPMTEDESHLPGIFEFKRLTDLTVRSLFWGVDVLFF